MQRSSAPPQYRRRKKNAMGCTCDCNYARSLQGICKVLQIFLLMLTWIIIAASPYYRPIFVIGGETWPFHIVLLLSIVAWLATLAMYCLFMSGYHLSQGHRNWPKIEFWFNVAMAVIVLFAACLEAANVWRWDMSQGTILNGGSSYSSFYQYGLRPGNSFTATLNFNSYCVSRPHECTDYFNLMTGNNSYYTNHLFSVVLLFFALIVYLVSIFFAYRTWRVFERDMYKPGTLPKPTTWMRIQYGMETAANHIREKASKLVRRNRDDDNDNEVEVHDPVNISGKLEKDKANGDLEAGLIKDSYRSNGRESRARSHHSSHHGSHHGSHSHRSRRSHSESESRHHSGRHEEDRKSSRSSSTGRSKRSSKNRRDRSPPPDYTYEDKPLKITQPVGELHTINKKKSSKKEKKEKELEVDLSPVASVMI